MTIKYNDPKTYMDNEELKKAKNIVKEINRVAKELRRDGLTEEQIREDPYIKKLQKQLQEFKSYHYATAKMAEGNY